MTEAAVERALEARSPGAWLLDTLRRPGTGERLARPDAGPWDAIPERIDGGLVRWLGVSLESGLPAESARRRVDVTVLVFEVAESVLLATERADALDGLTDSVLLEAVLWLRTLVRSECILPVSSSCFTVLTRGPVLVVPL